MTANCTECKQPLIEVDNRGQHLRGCLSCNEWHDRYGNVVRLSEKDGGAASAGMESIPRIKRSFRRGRCQRSQWKSLQKNSTCRAFLFPLLKHSVFIG